MKSKRLQRIIEENRKYEKQTPYNYCDRWCERCSHEKQMRCRLYQDEFECKATCIAHGRDPDDLEITMEVLKKQFEPVDKLIQEFMEEHEIDVDDIDDSEFGEIRKHIEFVEKNPLKATAEQYRKKTHKFLEGVFYNKKNIKSGIVNDFETIAWYHALLAVKLQRALCGFHEPASEDEFALYDAVAQFAICKKAINESVKALRNLKGHYVKYHNVIIELLALLHNIATRIQKLEESI